MYSFGFEYPWALILLLIIPVFYYYEKYLNRINHIKAAKFSRIELLERALEGKTDYKKKLFMVLFTLAVITGVFAIARPHATIEVMVNPVRLMLVFDTSISMEATDMKPDRLTVARDTAVEFIKKVPNSIKIGLEYFYGSSYVAVSPSEDREKLLSSLSGLDLKDLYPGTAIGSAIDAAVNTLSVGKTENNKLVIILLTDGESNQGILPLDAAKIAKSEDVKIFTIGIGSREGAFVRGGFLAALDEGTLIEIANQTGGKYFRAQSKNDFRKIYKELRSSAFSLEKKEVELTVFFSAVSFALFLMVVHFGIAVFRPVF
ncbi:MAG: hypothetical protein A2Y25_05795 [Candidatus Melainabacteria bacterium GWF2_37_15]|nr:MAG: hypothetical protein A2Y25_05795 [Candidatus Melainabacteria bacterium GWF2_37_15]